MNNDGEKKYSLFTLTDKENKIEVEIMNMLNPLYFFFHIISLIGGYFLGRWWGSYIKIERLFFLWEVNHL